MLRALYSNLSASQRSVLAARGIGIPYSNFPVSGASAQSIRQSLRTFPQYNAINWTGSPVGQNWYDALQLTLTKRLSHGLSVNANYTFSKSLDLTNSPDIFNRSLGKDLNSDLPHQLRISADYTTPRLKGGLLGSNKII